MTTTNVNIAKTIFKQLVQSEAGTNRLNCMIGAYNFIAHENGGSFRFKSKNQISANYCKITLNSMDLYDVELGRVHGMKYTVKAESKGLYNDQLKDWFEDKTKLYLSL